MEQTQTVKQYSLDDKVAALAEAKHQRKQLELRESILSREILDDPRFDPGIFKKEFGSYLDLVARAPGSPYFGYDEIKSLFSEEELEEIRGKLKLKEGSIPLEVFEKMLFLIDDSGAVGKGFKISIVWDELDEKIKSNLINFFGTYFIAFLSQDEIQHLIQHENGIPIELETRINTYLSLPKTYVLAAKKSQRDQKEKI